MNEVIHVITTIEMGGAEKQLLVLAREQRREGRSVTVIHLKGKPELKEVFESHGVQMLGNASNRNPLIQTYIIWKIQRARPDTILHAHLPRAELICALSRRKNYFIVSRHNAEAFFPKFPGFLSRVLSKFVEKRATLVIAISFAVRDFLVRKKEIKDPSKIKVIHYGFDSLSPNKSYAVENLTYSETLRIGTISRLVPQKDLSTLLLAFKKFHDKYPSASLSIVGDGFLKNSLIKQAEELQIDDSIFWLGRTKDIRGYLESIDLFVLSSLYEGFGLVLLEAMCSGVPIIAANNSAIPEVMGIDYPGLFVTGESLDLSKKMESAFKPEFRGKLLSAAEERLDQFNPTIMRKNIDYVYLGLGKK